MSKLIAVCGSPESGKTTLGLKLAQELYFTKKTSVLFLSVDLNVPIMGYIFPHCKASDLYSIGKTLDKTDIYREDVMKQIVTVKTMMNFGFLGFKAGENKYTYPRPTEDKVLDLKCMTYYGSNGTAFLGCADKAQYVMNIMDNDLFLPIEEVKSHFKKIEYVLPYSHALKQQTITGTLSERLTDRKYREVISNLARAVI